MDKNKELQKDVALEVMKTFGIYKDYINKFKKDGTITLFENFGGFYIDNTDEDYKPLLEKIKEVENKYGGMVYAVTHEYTQFGELYDLLYISSNSDEWEYDKEISSKYKEAFAYVWNKSDDMCSEFGTVQLAGFGGGIKRIG